MGMRSMEYRETVIEKTPKAISGRDGAQRFGNQTQVLPAVGKSEKVSVPLPEEGASRRRYYQYFKGIFDSLMAAFLIVILSPLLTFIAIAIRLDSPGGALFRQERVGKDGRRFTVCKFRTMHSNNNDREYKAYIRKYVLENAPYRVDGNGENIFKVVDDPRVTRFGGWLRQTNLDELPQLMNILKGEMSFIGPRPDIPYAVAMYSEWHQERLRLKPGITGLWQVSGRKSLSFEDMVRLDITYVRKQSLRMDAKILWQTFKTILNRDGSLA
jgi:lipopolysaccharide/colanic/teichoic acid biosynthesis glycosyltransferase